MMHDVHSSRGPASAGTPATRTRTAPGHAVHDALHLHQSVHRPTTCAPRRWSSPALEDHRRTPPRWPATRRPGTLDELANGLRRRRRQGRGRPGQGRVDGHGSAATDRAASARPGAADVLTRPPPPVATSVDFAGWFRLKLGRSARCSRPCSGAQRRRRGDRRLDHRRRRRRDAGRRRRAGRGLPGGRRRPVRLAVPTRRGRGSTSRRAASPGRPQGAVPDLATAWDEITAVRVVRTRAGRHVALPFRQAVDLDFAVPAHYLRLVVDSAAPARRPELGAPARPPSGRGPRGPVDLRASISASPAGPATNCWRPSARAARSDLGPTATGRSS